jgi:hypothetical protein
MEKNMIIQTQYKYFIESHAPTSIFSHFGQGQEHGLKEQGHKQTGAGKQRDRERDTNGHGQGYGTKNKSGDSIKF